MIVRRQSNSQIIDIDTYRDMIEDGDKAAIYQVTNEPDMVAKVFHSSTEGLREKIEAMLDNPPGGQRDPGHHSLSWPIDLFFDEETGLFSGYLMHRIIGGELYEHVSNPVSCGEIFPHYNYQYIYTIAGNLARTFKLIHDAGHVIGGLDNQNILIKDNAQVTLIDTDGFQIQNKLSNKFYSADLTNLAYAPRESQNLENNETIKDVSHDLFGLGVLIFELLMGGHHPYSGVAESEAICWTIAERIEKGNFPFGSERGPIRITNAYPQLGYLPPEISSLFIRCFVDGVRDYSQRPSAIEWLDVLQSATEKLLDCKMFAWHAFDDRFDTCPWCAQLESLINAPKHMNKKYKQSSLPGRSQANTNTDNSDASMKIPEIADQDILSLLQAEASRAEVDYEARTYETREADTAELVKKNLNYTYSRPTHTRPKSKIIGDGVTPGRWGITENEIPQIAAMMKMVLSSQEIIYDFWDDGSFSAEYSNTGGALTQQLGNAMGQMTYDIEGNWSYDSGAHTLQIQGVVVQRQIEVPFLGMVLPALPPIETKRFYQITEGTPEYYVGYDKSTNKKTVFRRVS